MTGFIAWLKGVPGEIWAALGAVAVVLGIIAKERHDAKMDERRANKQREAETRVKIVERTDEVVTQERTHADQALEARDRGGAPPTYDELPDTHKAIAEGRAGSRR